MKPYYDADGVTLYHGDNAEILPQLEITADVCITDPPYGETAHAWDRWPSGWPALVGAVTSSLWCFGSARMFQDNLEDFADWRFAQDVVWDKDDGSTLSSDRFLRVHEHAWHFYRGHWAQVHHVKPTVTVGQSRVVRTGDRSGSTYGAVARQVDYDTGQRLIKSVFRVARQYTDRRHPTEKPMGILDPLVTYSCPPGGLVLDPFAGSGSTLDAARCAGRRAVGIEQSEAYCEVIATRLAQGDLFGGAA